MIRTWKFIVATGAAADSARWSWTRCHDGVAVMDSLQTYDEFAGCVLDAAVHGYVRGDAFEVIRDRRGSRRVVVTECAAAL